ncbi:MULTISPECIES: alanine racemase [unclassified Polaromonas]|jgi:alanine racemase|uniref:alanine racemase n=1 Tax=unclassified Polaromonas TaxID=2638319 RepID=UPI000BD53D2F|nr:MULTISPECIES: alanine racemase [unclassified Polaromonas]OYY38449.1 MAG: alanine racemase [Polaromonas sp. 35-63-35]OYZ21393.1 MAG: alanine racemase [Polaromonas sp. 16-63-31]OYZ79149.1 MAG: alanine racemase [Polaromonas sp. 24-63-21]OZA50187.1 MAG: alanine racemase [Polaromonas sp. 17-63-33]OZA89318.1 MAG: alanine racemase [Polaromonas sp. 39-63-25]
MPRPILATVHAAALSHNLARARAAAPDARVWAVVKANAYGHGIERVFDALRSADGFALLDLSEAQRLRALDWRGPILLLEGCFDARDLELCSRLGLWHAIHCDEQIDILAAHKTQVPHRVFLKMNSGMNRLGFTPERYRAAWTRLNALPQVEEISLMTHFSDADGARGITHQLQVFEAVTHDLPGERTLSNSAATLRHGLAIGEKSDWVRPGIAVYGSSPDFPEHSAADWGLLPTMTLASKIIGVQQLVAGDTVGYGSSFTADGPLRIGVVACGYADGYPRHCTTGTPVLVHGVRTRMVGRVSMDMITVDLTPVPDAGMGSDITLWGRASNGALLSIDEIAAAAGTVGYELMCAVAARVPFQVD